jgi:hypothetical protein
MFVGEAEPSLVRHQLQCRLAGMRGVYRRSDGNVIQLFGA